MVEPLNLQISTKLRTSPQEIVTSFLEGRTVDNPIDYVRQICFESSANFPVYYYLAQAKITLSTMIKELDSVITTNQAKQRLTKRLQEGTSFEARISSASSPIANKKRLFLTELKEKRASFPRDKMDRRYFLQAIRALSKEEMDLTYLNPLLLEIYRENYGSADVTLADEIRRAICHLDKAYFLPNVQNE